MQRHLVLRFFALLATASVRVIGLVALPLIATAAPSAISIKHVYTKVYLVMGADVGARLKTRLPELLAKVPKAEIIVAESTTSLEPDSNSLVISIGDTAISREVIPAIDLAAQGPEGFIVRSSVRGESTYLVAEGNPAKAERTSMHVNRGTNFAAYEALQSLGFRFLHPFKPSHPDVLTLSATINTGEKPRWPSRGLHLHTMHPLELTHVLNGWGPRGPDDAAGFESLTKEWDLYCEWMIAHRQNTHEWVLLADKDHPDFTDSSVRLARLKHLVEMSHAWGLITGIDVGLVLEQQNMWRLLRHQGTEADDAREIRSRIDWLMKADWDYLSTELGSSEFTSPSDVKMLGWMNLLTDQMEQVYNRGAAVKAHVSSGQTAKHFKDPDTQRPLNINFLAHFADKRLSVYPHTVELYSLDDPAPTYGNKDFKEVARFMSMEAGERDVIWHPEAAYWVSYDIDVPLFLPSYGERRLNDLQIIARSENSGALGRGSKKGSHIQGQMLFSSGFEWGYWLNNLVAMHAAWNPRESGVSADEAYSQILTEILRPNADDANIGALTTLLTRTVRVQNDLLISGKIGNRAPASIERRSGIAYMAGQEVWDELSTSIADKFGMRRAPTQPNRLGFRSLRKNLVGHGVDYLKDVHPLLNEMDVQFKALADDYEKLLNTLPSENSLQGPLSDSLSAVVSEFADGARMNALRASQVHSLYNVAASPHFKDDGTWASQNLARAKTALDVATRIVARREKSYRTDVSRIAGWGPNPTAYKYGYLWTAHSLFYWWRDEGNVTLKPKNACFMNIVNPADVAFADGQKAGIYRLSRNLGWLLKLAYGSIKECLLPSPLEPDARARVRPDSVPETRRKTTHDGPIESVKTTP